MRFSNSLLVPVSSLVSVLILSILSMGCKGSNSDAAAGAASSAPSSSSVAPGTAPDSLVGPPPSFDVNATSVLESLEKDKGPTIGRYKGKNGLVYGPIGEVGKDDKRGAFVSFPKNPDDVAPDAPRLRCFLKAGEEAALSSRKRGDKVDAMGTFDEADGELFMKNCVVDTQTKICNLISKSLGRGACESNGDKLGSRWKSTTDSVEIVCQSPGGFEAWSKEWAAVPKDQQQKTKVSLDKTACHAVLESVNIKLTVDLTVALGRIRWVDNTPALAP